MFKQQVAVLIDGGFFIKRYKSLYGSENWLNAEKIAKCIHEAALKHVDKSEQSLYRIFYYDCEPLSKRFHHPITKRVVDFSKSEIYQFRMQLFAELRKKRKVALRLGRLKEYGNWQIFPEKLKALLSNKIKVTDLAEDDLFLDIRQKGIDIKIGVDIASLSLKKQVQQIVLISGDEDFVPASKLARREGVDFILDPLWNPIDQSLFEHIDGLKSTSPKPK